MLNLNFYNRNIVESGVKHYNHSYKKILNINDPQYNESQYTIDWLLH